MRIPGHGLRLTILHLPECTDCATGIGSRAPAGHGLCGCGLIGPHLPGYATRRRWHREHLLKLTQGEESSEQQ